MLGFQVKSGSYGRFGRYAGPYPRQTGGRLLVRGSTDSGKSTLLVALKARLGAPAFYWPTSDKLAVAFSLASVVQGDDESVARGFSSGQRQLKSLQEIVSRTQPAVYLLDEWDTNLDAKNRPAPRLWLRRWRLGLWWLKYRTATGCKLRSRL